jgi:2-methylcitrate dehydratase PrpD
VPTIARRLAELSPTFAYDNLPSDVVERTKQCILDFLGVCLLGATVHTARPALELSRTVDARGEASVLLHGERTAVPYAAYVNGAFSHACELDDGHILAGHPGACIIPVTLAWCQALGLGGRDLISATALGYQVMVCSCAPIHQAAIDAGWHSLKVSGVFGAAGATAHLLGLGPDVTTHALAIAGSEASGTMEYDQSGGEVKRLHPGMAARAGTEAAMLARAGLTGPDTIFEGPRGIYRLFGTGDWLDPEPFFAVEHHIMDRILKLYPSTGAVHAPIDALRAIQAEHPFEVRDVGRVLVTQAEWAVVKGGGVRHPVDLIGAQQSLTYSVALTLVKKSNELALYRDEQLWSDPEIRAATDKIEVQAGALGEEDSPLAGTVTVELNDGQVFVNHQHAPHGFPTNPASAQEVRDKFEACAGMVVPKEQVARIAELVDGLETLEDVSALTDVLVLDDPQAAPAR